MEQESLEKVEALKKVYADMILNTSKEAAARIMVAERKAYRFQQELSSTKEEAIRMLLRLKQTMDSKIADVESTSLTQKLKIEELEAQLQEAEDVVTDLRSQLEEVQNELDNVKKAQVKPFNEQTVRSNCCILSENATPPTEYLAKVPVEYDYAGNPDLASIILTIKDPEHYRNGCTQRIRAFERNLLDGSLPLPVNTDDQDSSRKSRSINTKDASSEATCTEVPPRDHNLGLVEKKSTILDESWGKDNRSNIVQDVQLFRRVSLRKSKSIYRKTVVVPCANSSLTHCGKDISRISEEITRENSEPYPDPVSSLDCTNSDSLSGSMHDNRDETEITRKVNVQIPAADDKVLVYKSQSSKQDDEVAGSLGILNCWRNYELADPPTHSNSKDVISHNTIDEATTQAVNDRLLKYTFQRKRKKGSLCCLGKSECQEKDPVKKLSEEKQFVALEPHKSSLIMESSRDSRRLVQVARQLISLSENRR